MQLPEQQAAHPDSGDADGVSVREFQSSERQTSPTPSSAPHTVGVGRRNLRSFWGVDVKPVATYTVSPEYPDLARKAGLVGHALMKFTVNVDGSVSDITYFQGQAIFKEAAIDAISQFRFRPAQHKGKAVPVWMTQRIKFQLPKQQAVPALSDDNFQKVEVERKPELLHFVRPVYPSSAAGITDKVLSKFLVNANGSVSKVQVVRGREIFHKPAIDAILQWRFIPARSSKGKVVPVWMIQTIHFKGTASNGMIGAASPLWDHLNDLSLWSGS